MQKQTAIKMLGGTPGKAAAALGYETVQAIYMWPETLPLSMTDRVNGAALRLRQAKKSKRSNKKPEAVGV